MWVWTTRTYYNFIMQTSPVLSHNVCSLHSYINSRGMMISATSYFMRMSWPGAYTVQYHQPEIVRSEDDPPLQKQRAKHPEEQPQTQTGEQAFKVHMLQAGVRGPTQLHHLGNGTDERFITCFFFYFSFFILTTRTFWCSLTDLSTRAREEGFNSDGSAWSWKLGLHDGSHEGLH